MAAGVPSPSIINHVVSLHGRNSGLRYFEVELQERSGPTDEGEFHIGITRDNPPATNVSTADSTGGLAWRHYGGVAQGLTFVHNSLEAPAIDAGDVLCFALNFTTLKGWIGKLQFADPNWVANWISGDPAAGTAESFTFDAGTYYVASCAGGTNQASTWSVRLRGKANQVLAPIPAGFEAIAGPAEPVVIPELKFNATGNSQYLSLHGVGVT